MAVEDFVRKVRQWVIPVSTRGNNPANDTPECTTPLT